MKPALFIVPIQLFFFGMADFVIGTPKMGLPNTLLIQAGAIAMTLAALWISRRKATS